MTVIPFRKPARSKAPCTPRVFTSLGTPRTLGELRALTAHLPDDTPLHQHAEMGEYPPGLPLTLRKLAPASYTKNPAYVADVETDPLWSQPGYEQSFGPAFTALCSDWVLR